MIHDAILLLWNCQNSNSELLTEEYYKDKIAHLNSCEREIFNRILNVAKCHGNIRKFIRKYSFVSASPFDGSVINQSSGSYIQALSEGLDEILEPYRLALIELEQSALANPYLPLSFVLGTVEKYKPLFNTINSIISSIREQKSNGCQVLNVLQRHALSGNEETTLAIRRLIAIVHRVFYDQLCSWLLYGDLKDNQKEFFIYATENIKFQSSSTNLNLSRISSTPLSEHSKTGSSLQDSLSKTVREVGYNVDISMVPYYIPPSMAHKALFIGKSVALFDSSPTGINKSSTRLFSTRKELGKGFTIWGDKEAHFHRSIQELKNMDMFNLRKLDEVLDEIKLCVTEHLWTITVEEACVLHEMQLMKDFYLLGRGELFLELLRLSHHMLDMPPNQLSTRDMNQAFNSASRSMSLGNSKDVEKFYFTLPFTKFETSNSDVEFTASDGWSVLVLNYRVKWPLHLLFTQKILKKYNDIFKFLFRVKKTQHDLHCLWFQYSKTRIHRTSAWQLQTKLMFLVDNLQHYLQFDVLESNYSKLKLDAEKIKDFELLKKAHNTFLFDILRHSFLIPFEPDESSYKCETDQGTTQVMVHIREVLHLCDAFCTMSTETTDPHYEEHHSVKYTYEFETIVGKLLKLLTSLRSQPCGAHLARLIMRLDFNRWFSNNEYLKQSHYLS